MTPTKLHRANVQWIPTEDKLGQFAQRATRSGGNGLKVGGDLLFATKGGGKKKKLSGVGRGKKGHRQEEVRASCWGKLKW